MVKSTYSKIHIPPASWRQVGVQPTLRTDDTACEIGPKGVLCCGIFGRTRVLDGEQHFSTDSSNFLPRIKDGVDTVGEPIFLTVDALYGTMTLPRAGVLWPLTFDTTKIPKAIAHGFFKKWLQNHSNFLLHFLIHIDVLMLWRLILTNIF